MRLSPPEPRRASPRGATGARGDAPRPVPRRAATAPLLVAAIAAAAAALLLFRLGRASLADWDEALYAQISKEIVQSGEWLSLQWEGRPYLRKPPLFMWVTSVFFAVFGVSEFWARAASALSGIAVAVLTFLIGRRVYGTAPAAIGAGVLLTSYQFVSSARFGTTDMMLTLFVVGAIYAYLRLDDGDQRWWLPIWLAFALAFLVKSAAGLVAPLAVCCAIAVDGRITAALRARHFWLGAGVAMFLVLPWHGWMLWRHGAGFVDQYFGHSIVHRATGVIDGHAGGRLYYAQRLYWYFFPWILLTPFALAVAAAETLRGARRVRVLLLAGVLIFGVFTIAETKLRWYILPLYPLLALFVGNLLARTLARGRSVALGSLLIATLALLLTAPARTPLLLAALTAVLTVPLLVRRRSWVAGAVTAGFFCVALVGLADLYRDRASPVAILARTAGENMLAAEERLVVSSGLYRPAPLFYSDRPIHVVEEDGSLASVLADGRRRHALLRRAELDTLALDHDVQVIATEWELVYATIQRRGGGSARVPAATPRE